MNFKKEVIQFTCKKILAKNAIALFFEENSDTPYNVRILGERYISSFGAKYSRINQVKFVEDSF